MKRCMLWSIVLIMVLSLTTVCAENQQNVKGGKLKGKKIVMIIAKRMIEEVEFKESKDIFYRKGAAVTIASSTLSMATGGNLMVQPDILSDNINVNDYDAVVFIGGFGVSDSFNNYQAHELPSRHLIKIKF
jgi:protease I